MTPKELAEFDQGAKAMGDTFPPMLFNFYHNCVKEGFTVVQAFEMTKTFLFGLFAAGRQSGEPK